MMRIVLYLLRRLRNYQEMLFIIAGFFPVSWYLIFCQDRILKSGTGICGTILIDPNNKKPTKVKYQSRLFKERLDMASVLGSYGELSLAIF